MLIVGGSMIDVKRINSQLSLSHAKAITSVDRGGGLMMDVERINNQLSLLREKMIAFVEWGGGGGN